jgi:hypothetical protein
MMEKVDPETVETPNTEMGMRAFFKLSKKDTELAIMSYIYKLYPDLAVDCMVEVLCAAETVAVAWKKKPEAE